MRTSILFLVAAALFPLSIIPAIIPRTFDSYSGIVGSALETEFATSSVPTMTSIDALTRISLPIPKLALETAAAQTADVPVRISVPAIGLVAPVQAVGLNAKKEMDVPSGKTNSVGWYKGGTVPGDIGSAVMDAHVFAAFSQLDELKPGDSLDVENASGATLHFVVTESEVYPLANVPLQKLFNTTSGRYLHLITCAGNLTADHSTYDHRLIVYAKLTGRS